jgi:hypothetical protein
MAPGEFLGAQAGPIPHLNPIPPLLRVRPYPLAQSISIHPTIVTNLRLVG